MKSLLKLSSAFVMLFLFAGSALGAHALATGTVKGVDAEKGTFALTDSAGKDATFKLGDKVIVNRGGVESKSDLKAGDVVNVCYDKGLVTWTADYILIQEGDSKKWELAHASFKSYDPAKKEMICTDTQGKDCVCAMGDAKVRINCKEAKVEDLKIGEKVLCIVLPSEGDKKTLQAVMCKRAK